MSATNRQNEEYLMYKTAMGGKSGFIKAGDKDAMQALRNKYGNTDIFVSVCSYEAPDISAPRTYPLYFKIASDDLEKTRISTLEACYYLSENFSIPDDCIEVIYTGGGAAAPRHNETGVNAPENSRDRRHTPGNTGQVGGDSSRASEYCRSGQFARHSRTNAAGKLAEGIHMSHYTGDSSADICRVETGENGSESSYNSRHTGNGAGDGTAEMVISIPPVVFGGKPTPLMSRLNYDLARRLVKDRIRHINIDCYEKDHFLPLPNSKISATGRHVIPLSLKELMYLAITNIIELSKQPRPEDSMIMPRLIPEAAEWFAEELKEAEKKQQQQDHLQSLVLEKGWQITPCIRQLTWMDLSKEQAFEACRILSQFYSWIKAGPDEIWHHLQRIDRRNCIGNYLRLKAIIAFALENPGFAGCQHLLLKQFCPAGKCFIKELIDEYEKPYLFNDISGNRKENT